MTPFSVASNTTSLAPSAPHHLGVLHPSLQLQPLLALLGASDPQVALSKAQHVEDEISRNLETSYVAFLSQQDDLTTQTLHDAVSAAITYLEKQRVIATKRGVLSGTESQSLSLFAKLKQEFKEWGDGKQHYRELAAKYEDQLKQLRQFQQELFARKELGRRLLPVEDVLPVSTQRHWCYNNFGVCSLRDISNGYNNSGSPRTNGVIFKTNTSDDMFGFSISATGDINGDGIDDLVLGAPFAAGQNSHYSRTVGGAIYVVLGNDENCYPFQIPMADIVGNIGVGYTGFMIFDAQADDEFGFALAVGDIDGDHIDDIVVNTGVGKTYVIFGSNQGDNWAATSNVDELVTFGGALLFNGAIPDKLSGQSLAVADINGDGLSDIILSSLNDTNDNGHLYVVYGQPRSDTDKVFNLSALAGTRAFVLHGEGGTNFTSNVNSAGDVNGDGIVDIIWGVSSMSLDTGRVYLIFGSNMSNAWASSSIGDYMDGVRGVALDGETEEFIGSVVCSGGDVNGDGFGDVMIGSLTGTVSIVFGAPVWSNGPLLSLMDAVHGFAIHAGPSSNETLTLSGAGDFNGDGIDDFIIGVPGQRPGRTFVLFGTANGDWGSGLNLTADAMLAQRRGFVLEGEYEEDFAGTAVSVGDFNKDGLPDIMVIALEPNVRSTGTVYVILSNDQHFTANNLRLYRGETALMGVSNIQISGTWDVVDVLSVEGGFFSLQGNLSHIQQFANADVGNLVFSQTNSSIPRYQLMLGNTNSWISISSEAQIEFNMYPPMFVRNSLFVEQGRATKLTSAYLNVTDEDDSPGNVLIVVSGISNGRFDRYTFNGTVESIGVTHFSLQDVYDGVIWFQHDGGDAPSYMVALSDLNSTLRGEAAEISFQYKPQLSLTPFIVDEGQATILNRHMINATDKDTQDGFLQMEVQNVVGGYFIIANNSNFTLNALSDNLVSFFVHEGAVNVSFEVRVVDGSLSSEWSYAPVRVNHLPIADLNISDVNIVRDRVFDITLSNPIFNDPDEGDNLTIVAREANGDHLPIEMQFIPPYTFHGQLLGRESIVILLIATDTRSLSTNASFVLKNFNAPPILTLYEFTFDQGQATTLSYQSIDCRDAETFEEDIILRVSNVTQGKFIYASTPDREIEAFRQLALIIGTVQFAHNGSDKAPTFNLQAYDGNLNSTVERAIVSLNLRPILQRPVVDQYVAQGEDFSFSFSGLFVDEGDNITINATLQGGAMLPKEITFIPPYSFTGNLLSVGSMTLELQARDARSLITTARFSLVVLPAPASVDVETLIQSFSGIAGAGVTILAYLWFRKRIANHRRRYLFANHLRKVLNLEYYDFMRFDGEAYKSQMGDFLLRLKLSHNEFYAHLSLVERESFAVCVAEILTKRGLVRRSDMAGGYFGILCCLNVGWPSELDLEKFEEQSVELAAVAVEAWKMSKNPLMAWPYFSPTVQEKCLVFCCCEKPKTEGRWFFDPESIELNTLKRVEGECQPKEMV